MLCLNYVKQVKRTFYSFSLLNHLFYVHNINHTMRSTSFVILLLFLSKMAISQCYFPLSLDFMVNESDYIVEGKVIDSKVIDGFDSKMIYTSYTVELTQVIKGETVAKEIEIIRPGGEIDNRRVVVTAVLEMEVGQVGTFFLEKFNKSLLAKGSTKKSTFKGTASLQSSFVYDPVDLSVSNSFLKYKNYKSNWYAELGQLTNVTINDKLKLKSAVENKSAASITSFSPTTITAGTKEELTINGSGFGATRGSSVVQFRDPNTGGGTWISASDVHYQSWSDSQIRVFVPNSNVSRSGTGQVRVIANGMTATSASNLTVLYAIQNLEFNSGGTNYLVDVQHIDDNGSGGITFNYCNSNIANNAPARASFESAVNSWRCKSDMNWIIGDGTSVSTTGLDGTNVVIMDSSLPNGVLGRATSFYGCGIVGNPTWNVNEIDIVFSSVPFSGFTWYYGAGTPPSSQFDFESVAVHELGHGHQLGHVVDNTKVMHYTISNGISLRAVDSDSENGAIAVMNLNTTSSPPCGSIMTYHDHVVHVDEQANGFENGDTWNNAYSDLQDALNVSPCGEKIEVSTGTYYTDEGDGLTNNDRSSTFLLNKETIIEGGYPSGGGTRNISANPTILSGDINQDNNPNSFAYTVVTVLDGSTLDGIIIEKGSSSSSSEVQGKGGGIYINDNTILNDCTIRDCQSISGFGEGGGIYHNNGNSRFSNTNFNDNSAQIFPSLLSGLGGGILLNGGVLSLDNCVFTNNGDDAVHNRNASSIQVINTVEIQD